jgi:hypothetical protein
MPRNGHGSKRSDGLGHWFARSRARQLSPLLFALLIVVIASTVLALRADETVAAVDPAPQTLAPETGAVVSLPPATVFPADTAPQPLAPPEADLASSFAELQRSTNADIGVTIAAVGSGAAPLSFGDWTVGPAWSTIKVPLAIAALRQSPSLTDAAAAAITQSDNGAAETLWASLGDPANAAVGVEAVLRESGDSTTVESRKVRPEYSAFGQTQWPLPNQAGFLAHAICDPRNDAVIDLMANVVGDQRWGLGAANVPIKGGWGPGTSGNYLVRQIGVIDTPTGRAAVALAAEPASGSFQDGVAALNSVADWLTVHNASLPSGSC